MNNLMIFENKELGIAVRTIKNDDGSISINAEATAKGLGFVQNQNKNGKIYTSIRWETMNNYCKEFNFPNKLGKDDYIPESLFYLLAMKANNEVARKFQTWLAVEVIPQIRKTGQYQVDGYINKLCTEIETLKKTINEATDYYKIQPKTVRKYTDYIKKRLKITHANEEFEQVKVMLFARLGIEKWCDIPTNRTDIYDLIEKCMQIVKKERPYEQRSFFE